MSLLEQRAAKSKEAKTAALLTGPKAFEVQISDDDNIASKLARALKTAELHELETTPRDTVLRMLVERKLEELFTFKVSLGKGKDYVQAMRMVLSRVRQKARINKTRLDEFKLFEIEIRSEGDHDVVVLMRSKRMSAAEESVYDKITELFEKKPLIPNQQVRGQKS